MKIYKIRENIPDPYSYIEAMKKFANFDSIKNFASIEDRQTDFYFVENVNGNHTDVCKTCLDGNRAECETLQRDIQLDREKNEHWGNKIATFKKCPAIIDLFRTGIILPAWEDLHFEATIVDNDPNKRTLLATNKDFQPVANFHTVPQIDFDKMNFDVSHNLSVKLRFPYRIEASDGMLLYMKSLFWIGELPFRVIEGLQDTSALSEINLNTIWKIDEGMKYVLQKGDPIVHIFEVPKDSVVAKNEIVQFEDIDWDYWKEVDDFERNVRKINGYRNNQRKK